MFENEYNVDRNLASCLLTPEEAAQFFRKSVSWVYKNWKELGGRKLGGSLFFPRKEDLYERIFSERKGVAIRLHPEGNQVYGNLVQNQTRGKTGRIQEKGGNNKSNSSEKNDPNRHGLLDVSQQTS